MESARGLRIECMAPQMVEVLRAKTPAERLAIANGIFRSAQRMIASHLRSEHPEWSDDQIEEEAARRIARGSG